MSGLYLFFCLPLGFTLIGLAFRTVPPERRWINGRYPAVRICVELVLGIALLGLGFRMLPGEARTAQSYATDWGCRQGTGLNVQSATGLCRVEKAVLRAGTYRGRKGTTYYTLTLSSQSGLRSSITLNGEAGGMAVWNGAHDQPDTPARVQWVGGRPVLITTDAGTMRTQFYPQSTFDEDRSAAAFGGGLIVAALLEIALAALLLPPGY